MKMRTGMVRQTKRTAITALSLGAPSRGVSLAISFAACLSFDNKRTFPSACSRSPVNASLFCAGQRCGISCHLQTGQQLDIAVRIAFGRQTCAICPVGWPELCPLFDQLVTSVLLVLFATGHTLRQGNTSGGGSISTAVSIDIVMRKLIRHSGDQLRTEENWNEREKHGSALLTCSDA